MRHTHVLWQLQPGPVGSTSYVDTTSSSESEDDAREATSILDVLKAPKVSVQNRKRRVLSNPGRGKRQDPPQAQNQKEFKNQRILR